jgi:EPS-associated MarR family transcriptional regulator
VQDSTSLSSLSVLRLLEASPSRSQRQIAHELGMSVGKANYVLRALLAKGLVKARNFRNSTNKRAYLYLLTPAGAAAKADLTRRFLARKLDEYEALRLEIERLREEAGTPDARSPESETGSRTLEASSPKSEAEGRTS